MASPHGEPLLLKCRLLLRCAGCSVERDRFVLVEDGVVSAVGPLEKIPPGAKTGTVVECRRRWAAMPCLYNAHTHAAMTLLRGYYDDAELHEWLARMWYVEKRLEPSVVYHASRLAMVEMLFSGTCGFMDMYFMPWETARAAWEMGLRARLGPVIMGLELDPHRAVEEAARFARLVEQRYGPRIGGVVNVHSIYAAPLEAVRLAAEASRKLGAPLHIHASETKREVYESRKRYGKFPVELLDSIGALHEHTVLVHMGWAASWELELARRRGASLVHCPVSNMKLATGGHFPLREALDMGLNVGLGTDGPASNNTLDMLREMRAAALLQRHSYWDTRVAARHVLYAATEGSAKAMKLPEGAGRLEPGSPGDVLVLSLDRPGLMPLEPGRLVSHIVYSAAAGDPAMVVVDGEPLLAPWSREKLLDAAEESASRLEQWLDRLGEGRDPSPPCSPPEACHGRG